MLTTQRKTFLLARLAQDGQLVAKDLAQALGTSEDTIRRDLRALHQAGALQRVHGGALPIARAEGDMQVREGLSAPDKAALGRYGASLVRPGQVVLLDGGTTAAQLARHLDATLRATIVTHSPTVALEAARHPQLEVVMLGGRLFRHSLVNVGAAVIDAASHIRADIYFLGVTGVHPAAGLTTGDVEEAAVKRALMARAAETMVLASSEKLMAASAYVVAPLVQAARIVVPAGTGRAVLRPLRAAGVAVTVLPRRVG